MVMWLIHLPHSLVFTHQITQDLNKINFGSKFIFTDNPKHSTKLLYKTFKMIRHLPLSKCLPCLCFITTVGPSAAAAYPLSITATLSMQSDRAHRSVFCVER